MAASLTNTYTGAGIAEDFQNVIFDISPEDTPLISMCKRVSAGQTYHQWQTDALTPAGANRALEGDDATYATLSPTTVLGNYMQISRKTVQISNTYDVVKKYGRKSEVAYQLMKAGKELKRDMEYAIVRNQASSAGGVGTARSSAGIESWIAGNSVEGTGNTTGTTPGFSGGLVAAPTDGTQVTFIVILMSPVNKARFASFAGIAQKYNEIKGTAQGIITGAADMYVNSGVLH